MEAASLWKETSQVIQAIEAIMKYDTAGDPMAGQKWTRRTAEKIAQELRTLGIEVSRGTTARLLKAMDFSLRVNHKKTSSGSSENRDEQFQHIASVREEFSSRCDPVITSTRKRGNGSGESKTSKRARKGAQVESTRTTASKGQYRSSLRSKVTSLRPCSFAIAIR